MIKQDVKIACRSGLHARPAKQFAMKARKFDAEIKVCYRDRIADGKSIISLLQLGVSSGETITISAKGAEEYEALLALTNLLIEYN